MSELRRKNNSDPEGGGRLALAASVIANLEQARRIADYASGLGIQIATMKPRISTDHLGAVVADSVLQAGLNYKTVVHHRVMRIRAQFPETATLDGLTAIVNNDRASEFLLWTHSTKLERFAALVSLLVEEKIRTSEMLREWLLTHVARARLLSLRGIGPKTYDYMCCLVGIDCIAVDRHVRTFAANAGVSAEDYRELQTIVSFAADLLGIARRDFDAWIWTAVSNRSVSQLASAA